MSEDKLFSVCPVDDWTPERAAAFALAHGCQVPGPFAESYTVHDPTSKFYYSVTDMRTGEVYVIGREPIGWGGEYLNGLRLSAALKLNAQYWEEFDA